MCSCLNIHTFPYRIYDKNQGDFTMSLKKIEAIEKKIQEASKINAKSKEDLLNLMDELKNELSVLKDSHASSAHNIADKTQASAEQILGKKYNRL